MKKKDKKLKISDINKNPQIERKNFIHKFIEHEHEIMIWTTIIIFIVICVVCYTCFFTIKYKDNIDVYYDGKLRISFNTNLEGVSDIISTSKDNIIDEFNGKKNEYTFRIKNKSLSKTKYKIFLEKDNQLIKLDECSDKLVNIDALRFSVDKGKTLSLKKEHNMYFIDSGNLNPDQEKEIKLKVWIDKNSMIDINKYHFHGRIIISNL